jgi:hypothetical protein
VHPGLDAVATTLAARNGRPELRWRGGPAEISDSSRILGRADRDDLGHLARGFTGFERPRDDGLSAKIGEELILGAEAAGAAGGNDDDVGWRQGSAIGVALLGTLVLAAGVDAWHLFYLATVRMESPFVIQRTLGAIHDPGMLGLRVLFEFAGGVAGVMLGWYLAALAPRWRGRRR